MSDSVETAVLQPKAKNILDRALSLHKATNIDDTLSQLAEEIIDFFGAECVRLFAYDAVDNEVYTRVKLNDVFNELKFSVSEQSVAGYTAFHKKTVALADVRDPSALQRFPGLSYDARYEDRTGVRVRSIVSAPMLENESDLIGVIQLVNTTRPIDSYTGKLDLLVHLGKLVASAVFQHDERQRRMTKFDFLLEEAIVSPEEVTRAISSARENANDPIKGDPVSVLMDAYKVPAKAMQASLSRYYMTDFLAFDKTRIIPLDLFKGSNTEYFKRNFIIPLELKENCLTILLSNPFNTDLIREIKEIYMAKRSRLFVGFRKDILSYIDHAAGVAPDKAQTRKSTQISTAKTGGGKDEDILNEGAPLVVQVLNKLILDAYQRGVSDIHIEPGIGEQKTTVRFRKDGACFQHTQIPASLTPAIINRTKIMAGLNISEHRFPQSGKIRLKYGDSVCELRVETTPTVGSKEDVVMRILEGGDLSEHRRPRSLRQQSIRASGDDCKALWHPVGCWPHRFRENDHPARHPPPSQFGGKENLDCGGPGGNHPARPAPGAGELQHQTEAFRFCQGYAFISAIRPRYHHGWRDARQRNRHYRRGSFPHRPPGVVYPAHQLGPRNHHPADRDGDRSPECRR